MDTRHAMLSPVICEASTLIVHKFSDTSGGDREEGSEGVDWGHSTDHMNGDGIKAS